MSVITEPKTEIWVDSVKVLHGSTVLKVDRLYASGLDGDRDADAWTVTVPDLQPKTFASYEAATSAAAKVAVLVDDYRAQRDATFGAIAEEWNA